METLNRLIRGLQARLDALPKPPIKGSRDHEALAETLRLGHTLAGLRIARDLMGKRALRNGVRDGACTRSGHGGQAARALKATILGCP